MSLLEQMDPEKLPEYVVLTAQFAELRLLNYPELLTELKLYNVDLDEDPVGSSLSRLNVKIAQVDAFKSRTSTIQVEAIENESKLESLLRDARRMYETQYSAWMLTPPISDYKSKEQREAAATFVMAHIQEFVDNVESSMALAKSFTAQVKVIADKLNGTNMNMSRQVTVVQLQVEVGEIRRSITPTGKPTVINS